MEVKKLVLEEKLQILRKRNGLSQEGLAEKLGISRQAVSKWESGQSTPDFNKLIKLSELYNVTIDSLVRENIELDTLENLNKKEKDSEDFNKKKTQIVVNLNSRWTIEHEYKSKATLFGIPFIHVNLGRGLKKAKGIIAVGNISCGIISIGFMSFGILSMGFMSIGLISLALLAIGFLLAVGVISLGIFSIGVISIGIYSLGALAIGKYAVGAYAIGLDIAIGDFARGNIAIGNKREGMYKLPLNAPAEQVKDLIKQEYPNLTEDFINIINKLVEMTS